MTWIKFVFERSGNNAKILVPPSRIFDEYADVNSFKIHHQSVGLLSEDIEIEEQNDFIKEDLECQRQKVPQEGLLARAEENVRQMLATIISKRGLNENFNVAIVLLNQSETRALNAPHDD